MDRLEVPKDYIKELTKRMNRSQYDCYKSDLLPKNNLQKNLTLTNIQFIKY